MSSPILEYIYQYTGIDAAYIILALAVLVMILLIVMIVVLCKQKRRVSPHRKLRLRGVENLVEKVENRWERMERGEWKNLCKMWITSCFCYYPPHLCQAWRARVLKKAEKRQNATHSAKGKTTSGK